MTKRQLFLIAGTIVLAACGTNPAEPFSNDETGEVWNSNRPTTQSESPAASVDLPEDQ
jgi:hypothetical protein